MFVVSWMPNKNSTYNHLFSKNGCVFQISSKGSLIEERYELNSIKYLGEDKFKQGDISFMCNDMILVKNNNDFISTSLHIELHQNIKLISKDHL